MDGHALEVDYKAQQVAYAQVLEERGNLQAEVEAAKSLLMQAQARAAKAEAATATLQGELESLRYGRDW